MQNMPFRIVASLFPLNIYCQRPRDAFKLTVFATSEPFPLTVRLVLRRCAWPPRVLLVDIITLLFPAYGLLQNFVKSYCLPVVHCPHWDPHTWALPQKRGVLLDTNRVCIGVFKHLKIPTHNQCGIKFLAHLLHTTFLQQDNNPQTVCMLNSPSYHC